MSGAENSDQRKTAHSRKFFLARDIALLASEDLLPFSLVDGTGFRRFLLRKGVATSESDIPVRSTISRGALDDAYEKVKEMVVEQLPKDSSRFHVSTDIWTDRHRQLPFITIVLHYMTENFELKCIPLRTDYFATPHTGPTILEEIKNTLKEFKLRPDMMFAAISDSASNMIRGFKRLVHIRCADHRMHRALTADFYKTSAGKKVLLKREHLMKIHRRLIYRRVLIAKVAKERSQDIYLETLKKAKETEMASFFSRRNRFIIFQGQD